MNLLFICSRNQWRSPTAENIFRRHHYNTKSAGTSGSARTKVTEKLIIWADIIFVMEKRHRTMIQQKFDAVLENRKLIVLNIPDDYPYMHEELVKMLEITVTPYLSRDEVKNEPL